MNRFWNGFRIGAITLAFTLASISTIAAHGETIWCNSNDPSMALPCQPTWAPSVWFSAEYLYWQPTTQATDFAIAEDGTSLSLGSGQVRHATFDTDSGYRLRLGTQTRTGWNISFGYTDFNSAAQGGIVRPPGIGQLFATQSHPDGNEEAEIALAFGDLDYHVFDLVVDRSIHQGTFSDIRVFGGVRWANIEQNMRVNYDGRDFVLAEVLKQSDVEGAGLRMGTESTWRMAGGFKMYGQLSGGILLSELNTLHQETNFAGADVLVNISDGRDRAIPFLDVSAAIGWDSDFASILVGYEMENWFGLHDRSMFVDDIHEATFATISEDILLSGLFVRATIRR